MKRISNRNYTKSILCCVLALVAYSQASGSTSLVRRAAHYTLVKPATWVASTQFYKKHPWLVNTAGVIAAGFATKLAVQKLHHRYQTFTHNRKLTREKELIRAAACGDRDKVRLLLSQGIDVNVQDAQGYTALMRAAESRDISADLIVATLLRAQANVNVRNKAGDTALILVGKNSPFGLNATISALRKAGADINAQNNLGNTALIEASHHGHWQGVEELIKAGALLHTTNNAGETALTCAVKHAHINIIKLLVKAGAQVNTQQLYDHEKSAELWKAVLNATDEAEKKEAAATQELWRGLRSADSTWALSANQQAVTAALNNGADFNARNKYGQNAVTLAAIFDASMITTHRASLIMDDLLYRGARIHEAEINKLKHKDATWYVINKGKKEAARAATERLAKAIKETDSSAVRVALLHPYADINADTPGFSASATFPLLNLAAIRSPEIAQMLLDAGANVDVRDINGRTTLMDVARGGRNTMLQMLIQRHADVNAIDHHGRTALM
jgi:ankyrin repeat protein